MLVWLLLKGVLVGILIAVPAGPVGVLCIRRTIFHGRLAGFLSGLGAATADAVFGIIAGFGLTVVSDALLEYQEWLRMGGAEPSTPAARYALVGRRPPRRARGQHPEGARWW